jgi:hypothetical protein
MKKKWLKRLDAMNGEMENLINYASGFKHDALNRPPAPDTWSASQVLNHLILSEKYSLAYCEKKLSFNPTLKKAGILSGLKSALVKYYLLSPFKFKAPKGIDTSALPKEDTLDNIHATWITEREKLKNFIANLPDEYIDKEIYKHPFGGRLTINGMMMFFEAHFKNHKKQILRALNSNS